MDRLERAPDALWRQAGGVLVVAHATRPEDAPLAVTGIGSVIWLALDEPRRPAELAELATALADGPPEEATAALDELLELLERRDLVRRVS
jgi:hypothetical protein